MNVDGSQHLEWFPAIVHRRAVDSVGVLHLHCIALDLYVVTSITSLSGTCLTHAMYERGVNKAMHTCPHTFPRPAITKEL